MLFGITMPKSAKSDLNFLDRKNRGEMSMEKNRIRPIKSGKSFRMSYSRQKEVLEMQKNVEIILQLMMEQFMQMEHIQ